MGVPRPPRVAGSAHNDSDDAPVNTTGVTIVGGAQAQPSHSHAASVPERVVRAPASAAQRRRAARRQRSRPEIRNAPKDPNDRVGEVLSGTYRVEKLIAVGGMGSVFEVSHTRLEQHFAVKFLDASFLRDPEAYARFRREAEIASRLNHDNVVQVFDFNTDTDGGVYMVMELVEGSTLDQMIEENGAFSTDDLLGVLEPLCRALDACHAHDIVHRDLKPSSIIVSRDGPRFRVKLLDFGISKIKQEAGGPHTQDNVVMGTPNYMSPEQARGQNSLVDARTDIFALGAIAYEMISGRKAFDEPGLPQLLHRIVYDPPDPLSTVAPRVPDKVVATINRSLAKDPNERHATVDSFIDDLKLAFRVNPRGTETQSGGVGRGVWALGWLASLVVVAGLSFRAVSSVHTDVPRIEPIRSTLRPAPRLASPTIDAKKFSPKLAVPGAQILAAENHLYRADWAGLTYWSDPDAEGRTRVLPSHAPVRVLTLSNDGKEVLVGQADGSVSRWDRSIRERLDTRRVGKRPIEALAGGSGYLAVASGKSVQLVNSSTGKVLKRFSGTSPVALLLTRGPQTKVIVVRKNELEVIDADRRQALTTFPLGAAAIRSGYIEQTSQGFAKIWIDFDQGDWIVRRTYQLTQVSRKQPLTLELMSQRRLGR